MKFVVITANVGSLFEDLKGIEETWLNEVLEVIAKQQPQFVALHCQEVGGKDYKASLDPISHFYKKLVNSKVLRDFHIVRGFVDGDVNLIDHYTALASFYFVHKSVKEVKLYDYKSEKYCNVNGKTLVMRDLHNLSCVKKEKFKQSFAPDYKRSRKGFCRARWKFYDRAIEFVNVHLFHDDSNLISVRSSPSPYTAFRKQALKHVLQKLREDQPVDDKLYFIFGDFNFRLDVKALVQTLYPTTQPQEVTSEADKQEVIKILFRDKEPNGCPGDHNKNNTDHVVVHLEKKHFKIQQPSFQPQAYFQKLRPFDIEFKELDEDLCEFDVNFPPTYPFSEDSSNSSTYMPTRCPSWCDRVLLSQHCWNWLHSQDQVREISYSAIGGSSCVGDHKPVYLSFSASVERRETTSLHRIAAFFQSCCLV